MKILVEVFFINVCNISERTLDKLSENIHSDKVARADNVNR